MTQDSEWSNQPLATPLVVIGSIGTGTGLFVYSGTPGKGNSPILSITQSSVDPYGNAVQPNAATFTSIPMLIYSGPPAANNLIFSVSNTQVTDAFGNKTPSGNGGAWAYNYVPGASIAVGMVLGVQSFATASSLAGPWTGGASVSVNTGPLAGELILNSATTNIRVNNPLVPPDPVTPANDESWHDLGNLGVVGISLDHHRYRLTAEGEVEFDVNGAATGAVATATTAFPNTLPAAYRPVNLRQYPASFGAPGTATGSLQITTAGVVSLRYPALAAGNNIGCGVRMPRD